MSTPLDALIAALHRASDFDPRGEVAPEAVLWCDGPGDFRPLLPALRQVLPNLLTLGDFEPEQRQGPAIWLRAALGRGIEGLSWEGAAPAILYLPGVPRETLRAAEDCPKPLQLLAWYVVGGAVFGHPNAKDWTLRGFLAAKEAYGGLGLDVGQDEATRQALATAAAKLFSKPLAELTGRRLDAPWLHELLAPDLVEDTLAWLGGTLTKEAEPERFAAFQARAKAELKIDPGRLTPATAAQRMLRREGGWGRVWDRFAAGGRGMHDRAADALIRVEPPDLLASDPRIYAVANARQESALRSALSGLGRLSEPAARETVLRLAQEHEERCDGPWAARGHARLALALRHLAYLAGMPPLSVSDPDIMAADYAAEGWKADDAAIRALEAVAPRPDTVAIEQLGEDRSAVQTALQAIYAPMLQRNAEALQKLVPHGVPTTRQMADSDAVLFVDGLRMDLGHKLAELLREAGAEVVVSWRWTGFPTVTATCKPLASPAASKFRGADAADTFEPQTGDGKRVTQSVLLRDLAALGWGTELSLVSTDRCWMEAGHFDQDGHAQQSRMADSVSAGLSAVAAEALKIVRSGRRLRIATDHGWLLLPGGLPVASLPTGLTVTKWRRCAIVKDGASASVTQLPWTWNPAVHIATAPGIHVFIDGTEYAHGGVSPQESIVPELTVMPMAVARQVRIEAAEWDNMRVRLRVSGGAGLTADLRLGREGDGGSIVVKTQPVKADGTIGLLVPDDGMIGLTALLELRDPTGQVVASRVTVVGG